MKKSQSNSRKTLGWFWRFTRPNPFLFGYGTIGAVLGVLSGEVIPPLIISFAFNHLQELSAAGQAVTFESLWPYLRVYIGLSVLNLIIWRTEAFSVWLYMTRADQRIAEYLFNHVQHMGSRFHADRFGGALVSQVNKFLSAYFRFIMDFTWSIVTSVTSFVTSLTILAFLSPLFAASFMAVAAVFFTVLFFRMKKQAPYNRRVAKSESMRTAKIADTITNVATVRAFAAERYETQLFHKQASATYAAHMALTRIGMKNEMISQIGTNTMNILAFTLGIIGVTKFAAPVGTLYLTVSYTLSLTRRLWEAQFIMRNLNQAFGDASEMTEILALEPEVKDLARPEQSRIHRGGIRFQGVTFSYAGRSGALFSKLDFEIKPGEKVGLVGHSGGGKTTITQLLLRFMDIESGLIAIDGQDISTITQYDLRSQIAYVPQESLLFHRSLAANISYGKPAASEDEIIATAKMAHAHDFIGQLPEGYRTLVGERGVKLSGGQRQRIAIARAMLKNAPILVLDEATSALDSESEQLIQDALWKLMENRTAIVIAHRLSTIQKMDRILVMEDGQIVEQGTHKELLLKNGVYARLWARQSGGFLED